MDSIGHTILKEYMPEALALASRFLSSYDEMELLHILKEMEEMALSTGCTATRYRKFIVAYLAVRICLELPTLLLAEGPKDIFIAS